MAQIASHGPNGQVDSRENTPRIALIQQLRLYLVRALYAAANILLRIFRRLLWPIRPTSLPRKICIYRIGNVGDTVCALPTMRAIRREYPNAHIALVTSPGRKGMPGAVELLQGNNWLDNIIRYHDSDISNWSGKRTLLKRLREERFDLWIELPPVRAALRTLLRNVLFARLSGAAWGWGWRLCTIQLWRQMQSDLLPSENEVRRLLRISREEGLSADQVDYGLIDMAGSTQAGDILISSIGIPDSTALVALSPGCKRPTNRWPLERWIGVGRAVTAAGYKVLLVGGPGDTAICQAIAQALPSDVYNLAGSTELAVLPSVLRRCCFVVCVDSGIQHIAAASGVPCISLMAARDYRGKWHPEGTHTVIEKRVPCHTCLLESCPRDNQCMAEIGVSEVIYACSHLMRNKAMHDPRLSDTQIVSARDG